MLQVYVFVKYKSPQVLLQGAHCSLSYCLQFVDFLVTLNKRVVDNVRHIIIHCK